MDPLSSFPPTAVVLSFSLFLMLHETAVSWIRRREAMNRLTKPWEETPDQFATRLKSIVQEINETLNVDGLCRAFKQRVEKLVERDGDRITH